VRRKRDLLGRGEKEGRRRGGEKRGEGNKKRGYRRNA
jgi:hypothetical protein